jgi:CP family cyanate transporter-like MFS transporter
MRGVLLPLFAAALTLRPQVIALGPLLPDIMADLHVSHTVAGMLSTLPILCMGVFAPVAPWLVARIGASRGIAIALAVIGVFGLVRLWPAEPWAVVTLTFGVGLGMGIGNGILPVVTKQHFADRPAFATGVWVTGINAGSLAAAAFAVPVAHLGGGWRSPLAVFSVLTLGLALPWFLGRGDATSSERYDHLERLAERPAVWRLAAAFGLLSAVFYGVNAWLPAYFVERGWTARDAAGVLAAFHFVPLFLTLPMAWLADRAGSRRAWLVGGGLVVVAAFLGLLRHPEHARAWAALLGATVGMLFSLTMTLPLDVCEHPEDVGAVAAVMLGVGYTLAAGAPAALGAVRDATGTFVPVLWVLLVCAAGFVAFGAVRTPGACRAASRARTRCAPHRGAGARARVPPSPRGRSGGSPPGCSR